MINLINEQQYKEFSPIPSNYNIKNILPFFKISENIYLKPIIGIVLFEELLKEIENDNLTEDNKILLENYIVPYDAIAITYEALPFITYKFSEGGITRFKNDYSESIDNEELNNLSTYLVTQMQTLRMELITFLEENKNKYPFYKSNNTCTPTNLNLRLFANNKRY